MATITNFKNINGFFFTGIDGLETTTNFLGQTGEQTYGDIWFQFSSLEESSMLYHSGAFDFKLNQSGFLEISINENYNLTGITQLSTGVIYHSFWSYSPLNSLNLYLNGEIDSIRTDSVPNSLNQSSEKLLIGSGWNGQISSISFWSGALTSGEAKSLYADGGGTYYNYTFSTHPSQSTVNYIERVTTDGGFVLRPNQLPNGTGVLSAKFNSDGTIQKTYAFTGVGGDVAYVNGTLHWNSGDDTFSVS